MYNYNDTQSTTEEWFTERVLWSRAHTCSPELAGSQYHHHRREWSGDEPEKTEESDSKQFTFCQLALTLFAFAVLTVWDVVVDGAFEQTVSLDAKVYISGHGGHGVHANDSARILCLSNT